MPIAPLRPCPGKGGRCGNLVSAGRCKDCGGTGQRESSRWPDKPPVKRITGRRLQALRKALYIRLIEEGHGVPTCAICHQFLAFSDMERDHVVNLADGGKDEESNCAGVHALCHKRKTHHESMRGRQ